MTDIDWPYMVIEVELATRTANGIARYPLVRTWQGDKAHTTFGRFSSAAGSGPSCAKTSASQN